MATHVPFQFIQQDIDEIANTFIMQNICEIHWQDVPTSNPASPHKYKIYTGTDEYGQTDVITDLQIQLPSRSHKDKIKSRLMVEQRVVCYPSESTAKCSQKS